MDNTRHSTYQNQLYHLGAVYASVTGSGSTVYGIFDGKPLTTLQFPKEYAVWEGEM